MVPAALAVFALAAILVQGLLFLVALRFTPDVYHVAFIRTLICCATALFVAFAGSCWKRRELTNIAYATLAFVAAKLVFEDLRHGHFEFIAGSIFLFAITLIAVPRLARAGQKL
jgi:predicted tellurium resistance membrane protein TerC